MSKGTVLAKERESYLDNFLDELVKRFEGMSFFIPSPELTKRVINRLHYLCNNDNRPTVNRKALEVQRKVIAEQLYIYLANISKKKKSFEWRKYQIKRDN